MKIIRTNNKFPFLLTLCTLLGVAILCALGVWQLQRLTWKNELVAKLDAAYDKPPVKLQTLLPINEERVFTKVEMKGAKLTNDYVVIKPRTYNGKVGGHLYAPYKNNSGHVAFVNYGWIPDDYNEQDINLNANKNLVAVLRNAEKSNVFVPDNIVSQNQWYWPDLTALKQQFNVKDDDKVIPLTAWKISDDTNDADVSYPKAVGEKPVLKNDHLQYAFFWFSMALALIVIYGLKLRSKN